MNKLTKIALLVVGLALTACLGGTPAGAEEVPPFYCPGSNQVSTFIGCVPVRAFPPGGLKQEARAATQRCPHYATLVIVRNGLDDVGIVILCPRYE